VTFRDAASSLIVTHRRDGVMKRIRWTRRKALVTAAAATLPCPLAPHPALSGPCDRPTRRRSAGGRWWWRRTDMPQIAWLAAWGVVPGERLRRRCGTERGSPSTAWTSAPCASPSRPTGGAGQRHGSLRHRLLHPHLYQAEQPRRRPRCGRAVPDPPVRPQIRPPERARHLPGALPRRSRRSDRSPSAGRTGARPATRWTGACSAAATRRPARAAAPRSSSPPDHRRAQAGGPGARTAPRGL